MASYKILLLLILVSLLSFETSQAQEQSSTPVYLYHNCSGGNTTNGSAFQFNLKTLLSSLSSNAVSDTGFYNTTVPGDNPPSDSVYGLFMCRGDVPLQLCQYCVQNATQRLSAECSMAKQAVIWYDECTVRYSNRSFFSTFDRRPRVGLLNTANISNQETFMRLLFQTVNKTADEAARSTLGNKFATNNETISGFQSLYCLAQCTPDLSPSDCRTCLSEVIGDLPWCCQGKQGGRVLYPSCNIRPSSLTCLPMPPIAWITRKVWRTLCMASSCAVVTFPLTSVNNASSAQSTEYPQSETVRFKRLSFGTPAACFAILIGISFPKWKKLQLFKS